MRRRGEREGSASPTKDTHTHQADIKQKQNGWASETEEARRQKPGIRASHAQQTPTVRARAPRVGPPFPPPARQRRHPIPSTRPGAPVPSIAAPAKNSCTPLPPRPPPPPPRNDRSRDGHAVRSAAVAHNPTPPPHTAAKPRAVSTRVDRRRPGSNTPPQMRSTPHSGKRERGRPRGRMHTRHVSHNRLPHPPLHAE